MKKVICFLRVSSAKQTLTQQRDYVMSAILADGYKEKDVEIIGAVESATKTEDSDRQTLNEMWSVIESNPIERVYCFAVDRVGRSVKTIVSTISELSERKINTVVLTPDRFSTLDNNGQMSVIGNFFITFLSLGAQLETNLRKERVAVKKDKMRKQNQVVSGTVAFGYRKADDKTIEIDPEQAEVVRGIYQDVLSGLSPHKIGDSLVQRGIIPNAHYSTLQNRVRAIVINPLYSGGKPMRGNNTYPAIIDAQTQEKAVNMLHNRHRPRVNRKNVYFGKGLLRSYENNHILSAYVNMATYCTPTGDVPRYAVNINAVDTAIWRMCEFVYPYFLTTDGKAKKEEYLREIEENNNKIANIERILKELETKYSRAYNVYIKGIVPLTDYENTVATIKKQQDRHNKDINNLQMTNARLRSYTENIPTQDNWKEYIPKGLNDEQKKELIDKVFESVIIERMENGHIMLRFVKKGMTTPINDWVEYWCSGGVQHLLWHTVTGNIIDLSKEIVKKYTRRNVNKCKLC